MKKIILLLSIVFSIEAHASRFYKFDYKVTPGEDFTTILKRFTKYDAFIDSKSPTTVKTMKLNPSVEWKELQGGESLVLYFEDSVFDLEKYNKYISNNLAKIEEIEFKVKKNNFKLPEGYNASIYYMASYGSFSQANAEVAKINFTQNSPLTLGFTNSYFFKNSPFSVTVGVFSSILDVKVENMDDASLKMPADFGSNLYLEYRWEPKNITFFAGPEYDIFHTFNMEALLEEQRVYTDKTSVLYLAAGFSKYFNFFNKDFIIKGAISRSISTSYTRSAPVYTNGYLDEGAYEGFKYMLFVNYKFTDKIYFQSLIKLHNMEGPSKLNSLRVGLGVGYVLF